MKGININEINEMKVEEILMVKWHWALSGFMVSLVMIGLILLGKNFGLSSTYRTFCAIMGGGKLSNFFLFDIRSQLWNILFIVGVIIGGFIASEFFFDMKSIVIDKQAIQFLKSAGFLDHTSKIESLLPPELFNLNSRGLIIICIGGILSGFGARYAGGCTSGHFVSGLSNLQLPSLITLVFFMIGGMITTYFIVPIILK